jgi:hypothetical protein
MTTGEQPNHSHKGCPWCEHELRWCNLCDVFYCTRCGKEWVAKLSWFFTASPTSVKTNVMNGTITYHNHE